MNKNITLVAAHSENDDVWPCVYVKFETEEGLVDFCEKCDLNKEQFTNNNYGVISAKQSIHNLKDGVAKITILNIFDGYFGWRAFIGKDIIVGKDTSPITKTILKKMIAFKYSRKHDFGQPYWNLFYQYFYDRKDEIKQVHYFDVK